MEGPYKVDIRKFKLGKLVSYPNQIGSGYTI